MILSYNMDLIAQVCTTVLHLEKENPSQKLSKREQHTLRGARQTNFGQDQDLLLSIAVVYQIFLNRVLNLFICNIGFYSVLTLNPCS